MFPAAGVDGEPMRVCAEGETAFGAQAHPGGLPESLR